MAEDVRDIEIANVCVAVRCRPMNGREIADCSTIAVEFRSASTVTVEDSRKELHAYAFDYAFGPETRQERVFEALGTALLDKAFEGYNSTIFAYGQTGSGKTHTMMNRHGAPEDRGLVPRIADSLYQRIESLTQQYPTRRVLVCCSFLEIYNEVVYDLLVPRSKQNKGGLEVKEQKGLGIYVKDLTEIVVDSCERLNRIIDQGFGNRATAATKMNDVSSRSHSVFTVKLHQKDTQAEAGNTFSKLNLVDLAGSERAKATEATGERLKEGANINKSLSALGNVINALSSLSNGAKGIFVPYRNSKLTRVLQESLGGNSLCTMVAAVSPSSSNVEETVSTLNYARRAKTVKVNAVKNDEATQIRRLQGEIDTLKQKLAQQELATATAALSATQKRELEVRYESQIDELQSFMRQNWDEKQRLSELYEEEQRKLKDDADRVAAQLASEKQRRLQILENSDDIKLSLQVLESYSNGCFKALSNKVLGALKAEQRLRAQLSAMTLYRESAAEDFRTCSSCGIDDPVALLTLLSQVKMKLGSLRTELQASKHSASEVETCLSVLAPEVAFAVSEWKATDPDESGDGVEKQRDVCDILAVVRDQLAQRHARFRAFVQEDIQKLGFGAEMRWLKECLEDGSATACTTAQREQTLCDLRSWVAGDVAAIDSVAVEGGRIPGLIGLSSGELPDDHLSASSNFESARCARLLHASAFGGWCPSQDTTDQFLEINFGQQRTVIGISLQGRVPCTGEWGQTWHLLDLVLQGTSCKLPSARHLMRPPVQLVHSVSIALVCQKGCFATWRASEKYLKYAGLSRDDKIEFFEELVQQTNLAWLATHGDSFVALSLTPQDILSGKNCCETNRLLQLLAYLHFAAGQPSGMADVSAHWTTKWSLSLWTDKSQAWSAYAPQGGEPHIFDGNEDGSTVCFSSLPTSVEASKVRIHPVEWHRHVGFRCEIHVLTALGGKAHAGTSCVSGGMRDLNDLDRCIAVARSGIEEVHQDILNRRMAREREEELRATEICAGVSQAEQEQEVLQQRLRDAMKKIDELEARRIANCERCAAAETSLLQVQAQRDRLHSEVEQLESSLAATSQDIAVAGQNCSAMRLENGDLKTAIEDLTAQLHVVTEERDLARDKEEEMFEFLTIKEEDIMETNNGYVDLTMRVQEAEDEIERLDERMHALYADNDQILDLCRELRGMSANLVEERQRLRSGLADQTRTRKLVEQRSAKWEESFAGTQSPSRIDELMAIARP